MSQGEIIPRYITPKKAAIYLDTRLNQLYKMAAAGIIPVHRFGKKMLRFDVKELDDWMKNNLE